jgi:hypothetical protein
MSAICTRWVLRAMEVGTGGLPGGGRMMISRVKRQGYLTDQTLHKEYLTVPNRTWLI